MNASHDAMLDDVAVYALGTMNAADAARVQEHLRTCAECRAEYEALAPSASAVGLSAEACANAETGAVTVSPLLKARLMREVRRDAASSPVVARGGSWGTYLVAAACLAVAVWTSFVNISLNHQLHGAQATLAATQTTIADLTSAHAQRFAVNGGEIVRVHGRIYLAMHDMPQPPRGKVYQAWTLPKGAKTMRPSLTFVPDAHGTALVALPVNAALTSAVAVSVEPAGGSKQPTSKPVLVEQLG